jgi:microcystin-dependent protein
MSQPYVGQLLCVGFNFAPVGWMICAGQLVPISENETLFNLIGTTYGGDGQSTFALPDLRGRTPIHQGTSTTGVTYVIGQSAGVETVTLTSQQIPIHTHTPQASANNGNANSPVNNVLAAGQNIYANATPATPMNATMLLPAGGNQPHDNLQPYNTLNWIISMFGVFPSQG